MSYYNAETIQGGVVKSVRKWKKILLSILICFHFFDL